MRWQAEALLRCFAVPMRRAEAADIVYDRLQPSDQEWADELKTATTERIKRLCGDGGSQPQGTSQGMSWSAKPFPV